MLTPYRPTGPTPTALLPHRSSLRGLLSTVLHKLSQRLGRLAVQVAACQVEHAAPGKAPSIEYHADAGAPEGALYIDGVLVGHLTGVSRL